jgi:hypothetical protein
MRFELTRRTDDKKFLRRRNAEKTPGSVQKEARMVKILVRGFFLLDREFDLK